MFADLASGERPLLQPDAALLSVVKRLNAALGIIFCTELVDKRMESS
jgi:hypothetical protein